MLKYKNEEYLEEYDLANRSHTLIFYGDVVKDNIYEFKDSGTNKWDKARKKRIDRLSYKIRDLSSKNDWKKHCFRLFDIATIYCFIVSHLNSVLNNEEMDIVRTFNVDYLGEDGARKKLIEEIRDNIVKFLIKPKT